MDVDEPKRVQVCGQVPGPGLVRTRGLGRTSKGSPDLPERARHFIADAEPVAFLEQENAAWRQRPDQSLQNNVSVGNVQQHESCVDEIECAFGEFVGDEVDLGYFAATVGQVCQVSWVSVQREDSTTWQCGTA